MPKRRVIIYSNVPLVPEPRDYYVSVVRSSKQRGLLAGPFPSHGAALALVDAARRLACELDPWCDFDAFGTCSVPRYPWNPKGKLNLQLGVDSP
jgi:hypothetical protein